MSIDPNLAAKVEELRRRRRGAPAAEPGDRPVQLAVRLPAELRQQVHRAAAAAGSSSTQDWLHDVIQSAVDDTLDPQRRLAARLREALITNLAEQVDKGAYDAVLAGIADDDPDLA